MLDERGLVEPRRRYILSKMLVNFLRITRDKIHGRTCYALDDHLVLSAVFIGDMEGRPMSASKIALYTDQPRSTVLRSLKRLQGQGVARRHGNLYFADAGLKRQIGEQATRQVVRDLTGIVKAAADAIDELDQLETDGFLPPKKMIAAKAALVASATLAFSGAAQAAVFIMSDLTDNGVIDGIARNFFGA